MAKITRTNRLISNANAIIIVFCISWCYRWDQWICTAHLYDPSIREIVVCLSSPPAISPVKMYCDTMQLRCHDYHQQQKYQAQAVFHQVKPKTPSFRLWKSIFAARIMTWTRPTTEKCKINCYFTKQWQMEYGKCRPSYKRKRMKTSDESIIVVVVVRMLNEKWLDARAHVVLLEIDFFSPLERLYELYLPFMAGRKTTENGKRCFGAKRQ